MKKELKIQRYVKDFALIEIKEDQNLTHSFKGKDGKDVVLLLDNEYNRMSEDFIPSESSYIPHKATILSMPVGLSSKFRKNGIDLKQVSAGDIVYVNHLAVNANNRLTKSKYFLSIGRDLVGAITSNIIAKKVNNNIIPVFDWNTFKPVEDAIKSSNIIIPESFKKKREDILEIVQPSTFSKSQGIKPGDKLVVNPDAIYPMKIDDEDVWFVRNENILLRIL